MKSLDEILNGQPSMLVARPLLYNVIVICNG